MKKIFTLLILLLNIYSYATVTDEEIMKIEEMTEEDTTYTSIKSLNYKIKDFDIITQFVKYNYKNSYTDEDGHNIPDTNSISGFILSKNKKQLFNTFNYMHSNYNNIIQFMCQNEKKLYFILMYMQANYGVRFGEMNFYPYIYEIKKENDKYTIVDVSNTYKELLNVPPNAISFNLSYSAPRYPYYNKEKIIERLVETGFCKKNEIVEGIPVNIENNLKIFSLDDLIK
jgi:hypothetical protein